MTTSVSVDGPVATVTLDSPETANALSAPMVSGLRRDLGEVIADSSIRVVVLANSGRIFCAGADLRARDGAPPLGSILELYRLILDAPKPVVGQIGGHCTAGGLGLAAACDISIAAADARFGFTEVRVGVAPAIISVLCLPKLRRADASDLFLRGRRISAAEAAAAGIVSAAVPADRLRTEVDEVVADLLRGAPGALAATKRLLREVPGAGREEGFAAMLALSQELFAGEEATAGTAAFVRKEPAPWVVERGGVA